MVDIHSHVLPGLDDGPDTLEVALAMAEMAIADGITHVVGTPHASLQYPFLPGLVRQRRDELQSRVGDRLVLATGCDFHLSFENLQDLRQDPSRYTIHQKNYLLVELACFSIPPSLDHELHQLKLAGLHPVITHPERNSLIRARPECLFRWLHQGCYVQVTAQSLLGKFGSSAQRVTEQWLDRGAIHFVASDAHDLESRPLRLREAYERVANRKGKELAHALFRENPLAAFEGRPLPYAPEFPDPGASARCSGRRKRFWFF